MHNNVTGFQNIKLENCFKDPLLFHFAHLIIIRVFFFFSFLDILERIVWEKEKCLEWNWCDANSL